MPWPRTHVHAAPRSNRAAPCPAVNAALGEHVEVGPSRVQLFLMKNMLQMMVDELERYPGKRKALDKLKEFGRELHLVELVQVGARALPGAAHGLRWAGGNMWNVARAVARSAGTQHVCIHDAWSARLQPCCLVLEAPWRPWFQHAMPGMWLADS